MAEDGLDQSKMAEWYGAMSKIDRLSLQVDLDQRWEGYNLAILPFRGLGKTVPVADSSAAQRVVVLESYYKLLSLLFKGQDLVITAQEKGLTPQQEAEVASLRVQAKEEAARLDPVIRDGDWRSLKSRWIEPLKPPVKPQRTGNDYEDLIARMQFKIDEGIFRGQGGLRDNSNVRRIIGMIPDRTSPMNPMKVDPDPLPNLK